MDAIEIKNDGLLSGITQQARDLGITNAAIVTLIGAVDAFTISTMPEKDASKDIVTDYELPAEMTAIGEIVDGTVHVHAAMAVEGDRAVAGYVHKAKAGTWFARADIQPVE